MKLETLIIRLNKEQTRYSDQEMISILTEDNPDQLPFDLPEFVEWPSGPQSVSRKGRLLLLAGIKYMKDRYPKQVIQSQDSISEVSQPSKMMRSVNKNAEAPAMDRVASEARPANFRAEMHEPGIDSNGLDREPDYVDAEIPSRKSNTYDISLFQ